VFNIIARRTLLHYCRLYPQAATALKQWYLEIQDKEFRNFNELKAQYGHASIVADDRVVFNIMGNQYRLIVRVVFDYKVLQIKWFGSHADYDKTDVSTVQYKKP
jgi:mRNA interferase HigB